MCCYGIHQRGEHASVGEEPYGEGGEYGSEPEEERGLMFPIEIVEGSRELVPIAEPSMHRIQPPQPRLQCSIVVYYLPIVNKKVLRQGETEDKRERLISV